MKKSLLLLKKNKKIFGVIIVSVLLLLCLLPVQNAFAAWPFPTNDKTVGVDGRILLKDKTGDSSDWVEIARNGEYSLIVRKNYINTYPQANRYGDHTWQYTHYGMTDSYITSQVRDKINAWFNGFAATAADNLHWNARLRDYTMQHSAKVRLGTCCSSAAVLNGISRPTIYQVGVGDDIAFALSYGEVANFSSKAHFMRKMNPAIQPSSVIAYENYKKISLPAGYLYGMWLRSPGDINGTAGFLSNTDYAGGTVFQAALISGNNEFGLIYPALWVDADIFSDNPNKNKVKPGKPSIVDGRILTKEMAGDISDWVEIAQSDGFSLIVRKNYINSYPQAIRYGDHTWQYTAYGMSNNYLSSNPRNKINAWFNGCAPAAGDNLSKTSRLRSYAVQQNAKYVLGTCCNPDKSMNDGLSRPTIYQVGIGDDIAFALSYPEAASFASKAHFMRKMDPAIQPSSAIAYDNYKKISIPATYSYGMWLRSPGDINGTAGFLSNTSYAGGAVFQAGVLNNSGSIGLVYPALWVGEGVFGNKAIINVYHRDAETDELLEEENYSVKPGNYGPYNARTFTGYGNGQLASYSDPHVGVVNADETKNVTYLYPPIGETLYITYDPNNGEGLTNIVPVTKNTYYTIVSQGFTNGSLVFKNWNTKANGKGIEYNNDVTIFVTDNIILYAQWMKGF